MAPSSVEVMIDQRPTPGKSSRAASSGKQTNFRSGDPSVALEQMLGDAETTGPPTFHSPARARAYFKHRLAIAFRIFAQFGFCEGVAGHITCRDPIDPTSFWVNPFGLHFSLIRDDDLLRVSEDGEVLDGGRNTRLNLAAYAIHVELHRARPDVMCAAHAHTVYGRAMCSTGRPLRMLTQDFCVFWRDILLYENFGGVVLAAEEGRAIASALGGRKAALLANHGLLVAGPSIEATVAWFVMLEKCCQVQLLAEAAVGGGAANGSGDVVTIGDEEAQATWEVVGSREHGYFMGLPLFQVAEREFGESTSMGRGMQSLDA
ncbi:hypothetical protein MCOR02_011446 [Pyricularia oryzae]|nr:hypothetical protein MCOR02_011446 [Pyricularia oryzae]KAI6475444.1 hypothetical protein MCOR17_001572 [Pyricularia oryzae]KAI6508790.1 hypothetical protein MCOR13_001948 [Pyricularia oryzae]KAI6645141.1 hypothetical protein MCOR14_000446 [Pyricularia oryzae]